MRNPWHELDEFNRRRLEVGVPAPSEALRLRLQHARSIGVDFDQAWWRAVAGATLPPHCDEGSRAEWRLVFGETRDAWRRAFLRLAATRAEGAVAAVFDDVRRDRAVLCGWCSRVLPAERDPRVVYCSKRCRRRANYAVERGRKSGVSGGSTMCRTSSEAA